MTNEEVATDNQQKITNVTGIVSNGTGSMTTKEIATDNQQKKMSFLQGILCIVGGCVGLLFICTFPCPHCVYCRMIIKEFIKRKLFHKGSNAASSEEGTMNYPPAQNDLDHIQDSEDYLAGPESGGSSTSNTTFYVSNNGLASSDTAINLNIGDEDDYNVNNSSGFKDC